VHSGPGIDARRRTKTGRDHQFGARTTLAFADEVKRIAASRGITIGELLDDMLDAWRRSAR
jgi:predicted DNA-binding ribbon-helix-helix protein